MRCLGDVEEKVLSTIAIQRYADIMREKGLPFDKILADAGIESRRVADHDFLVDPMQCRNVVHDILKASGDNGIGFDVGMTATLPQLGPLGYATLSSHTIWDMYQLWNRFGRSLVGICGKFEIVEKTSDRVSLEFTSHDLHDPLLRFYVEEALGLLLHSGEVLIGEKAPIVNAVFSFPAPPHKARYHDLFQCPVRFGAAMTRITYQRRWFDKSLKSHDPVVNQACIRYCEEALRQVESNNSITVSLRNIFLKMNGQVPKFDDVARELNISSRTLRRRLAAANTTYKGELDAFRFELTQEYLKYHDMSSKEIAYLLGFDEPSSFHHAFKTWTGHTTGFCRVNCGNGCCGQKCLCSGRTQADTSPYQMVRDPTS